METFKVLCTQDSDDSLEVEEFGRSGDEAIVKLKQGCDEDDYYSVILSKEDVKSTAKALLKAVGVTLEEFCQKDLYLYGIKTGEFFNLLYRYEGNTYIASDIIREGSHSKEQQFAFENTPTEESFKAFLKHPKAFKVKVSKDLDWDVVEGTGYYFEGLVCNHKSGYYEWINE